MLHIEKRLGSNIGEFKNIDKQVGWWK